jgi:hypothetical protein
MMKPAPYPEALQYLAAHPEALNKLWGALVAWFDDLPAGVRQALINRLIEIHKDTISKQAEDLRQYGGQ